MTPMAAVPAPSGRWTALHWAAHNGCISAGAELLVGGADQNITDKGGYRRAAHKPRRRPHTPIGVGKRLAKSHKNATCSARTTRRWRRRGRRIAALLSHCAPLAAADIVTHATRALARRGTPRPRSSAYADTPAA